MKDKLKKIIKQITIKRLIILILLLIVNSYAWFLFSTKVSTSLETRVIAWKIQFDADNLSDDNIIEVEVEKIYPGMEDYTQDVQVYNLGDIDATLTYEIISVTVFGDTYTVGDNITKSELSEKMENEFPFTITIEKTEENLVAESGEGTFTITFSWEFESGNDELDTEWGEKAYEFYQENTDQTSFSMQIKLVAEQAK